MPKVKNFDCVEMKNEIQARLLKRYEGMTEEEIQEDQRRRILVNPILGPIFRRLTGKTVTTDEPIQPES